MNKDISVAVESAPASARSDILDFVAVPVTPRPDGWTPERQRAFIEVLADTGSVAVAAKAVGMGVEGAYRLRRRPDAEGFAAAWDAAYGMMTRRLTDAAFARAIHGNTHAVWYQGEIVGERTTYDERLTRFLLERHDPRGHGYLLSCEARHAATKDPLPARLAALPRLIYNLFRTPADPALPKQLSAPDDDPPRRRRRG